MKYLTNPAETTVGCDPEVFFLKEGDVFPAIGLIGGSKEAPTLCEGGALQEDNVMAEFNTDPVTTVEEFLVKVETVYKQVEAIANRNGCTVGVQASRNLHPLIPTIYPAAKQFGCDPDFNAYTLRKNITPDPESLLRTCAGHIHLGYDVEGGVTFKSSANLVKYLDAFVGTFCVLEDKDTRRMSRYGKAGAFRHKPYGTEYRVPSNFWLTSKDLTTEIFNRVRKGYEACQQGVLLPDNVQQAIDTQDHSLCKEVLSCF